MADTLGPVSNVIALADLFIKVGVQCSVYCSGLKNAPRDVRLILNEADRFTATLKGVEKLLVNNSHSQRLSSLQNILGIVEESRSQLQDLAAKLERGTKLQKIMWPLRKDEVAAIISQLQKYRAAIALDLQVDQTFVRQLISLLPAFVAHNLVTVHCYSMFIKRPYWQSSELPKEQHSTLPATPTAPDAIPGQEKVF
jgi:hypothetical protein